jgi:hypothetical protein
MCSGKLGLIDGMLDTIFWNLIQYFLSYTIAYWITVLEIDGFVAGLAYVANAFLISLAFGVCTGTIGFFAAYLFVRRLYSSLKVRRKTAQMHNIP